MTKVSTQAMPTIVGDGEFLIASHKDLGYLTYEFSPNGERVSAVLAPGVESVVNDRLLKFPPFVRDFQRRKITLRRDNTIPDPTRPAVSPDFALDASQNGLVQQICYGDKLSQPILDTINLHELLKPGGRSVDGVRVTKEYLLKEHSVCLRAALDLEGRYKKRKPVLSTLKTALQRIEAL